mgnify:FL=1
MDELSEEEQSGMWQVAGVMRSEIETVKVCIVAINRNLLFHIVYSV